jgi:integrase
MTWSDVQRIGYIERSTLPSGNRRIRVVFPNPWEEGKRLKLAKRPTPNGVWVSFDENSAQEALAHVRNALLAGLTLEAAVKPYLNHTLDSDTVEARARVWLDDFSDLVKAEDRSPGTLREYKRYAEKYFGWWSGKSIYNITRRDVKDWQKWLAKSFPSIGANTRSKISDAFRSMLREHARDEDGRISVPNFPVIKVPPSVRSTMDLDDRAKAIAAIPWEQRGLWLLAASECVRLGEIRAHTLDDFEAPNRLRLQASIQGSGKNQRRVERNKNDTAEWRELWDDETIAWLAWRMEQATPESRLRGEVALFWHPQARNTAKMWSYDPQNRAWRRACAAAGVTYVPFQESTRHTTLSALSKTLPERMLQAHSRHKDKRSLDHYTLATPGKEALVIAMKDHLRKSESDTE